MNSKIMIAVTLCVFILIFFGAHAHAEEEKKIQEKVETIEPPPEVNTPRVLTLDDFEAQEKAFAESISSVSPEQKLKASELKYGAFNASKKAYEKNVLPWIQIKCMDCHSDSTKYPFYYWIPGIRQMIDGDIKEAREHIDFSKGFPFLGHGKTISEDLDELEEVIDDDSMPPTKYRLLHWFSGFDEWSREVVLDWIRFTQKEIKKSNERAQLKEQLIEVESKK